MSVPEVYFLLKTGGVIQVWVFQRCISCWKLEVLYSYECSTGVFRDGKWRCYTGNWRCYTGVSVPEVYFLLKTGGVIQVWVFQRCISCWKLEVLYMYECSRGAFHAGKWRCYTGNWRCYTGVSVPEVYFLLENGGVIHVWVFHRCISCWKLEVLYRCECCRGVFLAGKWRYYTCVSVPEVHFVLENGGAIQKTGGVIQVWVFQRCISCWKMEVLYRKLEVLYRCECCRGVFLACYTCVSVPEVHFVLENGGAIQKTGGVIQVWVFQRCISCWKMKVLYRKLEVLYRCECARGVFLAWKWRCYTGKWRCYTGVSVPEVYFVLENGGVIQVWIVSEGKLFLYSKKS